MAQYTINNQSAPIDFETKSFTGRTLQNAKNLLMIHVGEVPYDRMRGLDPAVYDRPIGQVRAILREEITRVMRWEPDAQVSNVRCEPVAGNRLYIEVDIQIDE